MRTYCDNCVHIYECLTYNETFGRIVDAVDALRDYPELQDLFDDALFNSRFMFTCEHKEVRRELC